MEYDSERENKQFYNPKHTVHSHGYGFETWAQELLGRAVVTVPRGTCWGNASQWRSRVRQQPPHTLVA